MNRTDSNQPPAGGGLVNADDYIDDDGIECPEWADEALNSDYVSLPATVLFKHEVPRKVKNAWNRDTWRWHVEILGDNGCLYDSVLSITSRRLLALLARLRPLRDKQVLIGKSGEGMTTRYSAAEV